MDQKFARMTVKRQDGRWAVANNDGASNLEQMKKLPKAIARLAAYEDTGLDPEEVTDLMAAHGTAIGQLAEYRAIGPMSRLPCGKQ